MTANENFTRSHVIAAHGKCRVHSTKYTLFEYHLLEPTIQLISNMVLLSRFRQPYHFANDLVIVNKSAVVTRGIWFMHHNNLAFIGGK